MAALALGTAGSIIGGMVGGPIGASIGYLAGSLIGNLIDPPKVEGPKLEDLKLQRSSYGAMIPVLYGAKRLAGNVIWQTDLVEHKHKSGGKGGPQVTSYTYTCSWAVALCEGPIIGIRKMWADGRLISTTGTSTDELPFVLYLGTETQLPDPTIEAEEGAGEVPAHRGMAYIVFTDVELTDYGNRIFQLEVEVEATSGAAAVTRVGPMWAPPGMELYTGIGIMPLDAAYVDGSDIVSVKYLWEYSGDYFQRQVIRHSLQTGELVETGPVEDLPFPGSNMWVAAGQNGDFAFGRDIGSLAYWYVGTAQGTLITAPSPMVAPWQAVTSRPIKLGDFVYAFGGSSTLDVYLYKWGFTEGGTAISGVAEDDNFFPEGASDYPASYGSTAADHMALAVSDDGFLYVWHSTRDFVTVGVDTSEMWKLNPDDMSVVRYWPIILDSECPGLPPPPALYTCSFHAGMAYAAGFSTFTVYRGMIVITSGHEPSAAVEDYTGNDVCLWRIEEDSDTFTCIDRCLSVDNAVGGGLPVLSLGGGYVLKTDGVFRIGGSEILGNIVADVSERCGLTGSPAQYEVSDLPDPVYGYVIASQMTGKNAIDPLRTLYLFDGAEVDDVVLFKHRTHDPVAVIDDDDLGVHDLGSQAPALLEQTRTPESELPRTVNLVYLNPDQDYQAATQYARRETGESELDTSLSPPIVMQDAEAREKVNAILFSAWIERTAVSFSLSRAWAALVPTDVVTIQGYRIRLTQVQQTVSGIVRCTGLITRAFVFDQESIFGAPGGGFEPQTGSATKAATELVLLDIPLQSSGDAIYGFYAAMAPIGSGAWSGASLFKSLDGGVNYAEVASTPYPATIGTATTALDDFTGGSPSSGSPIGGGALALWETRVIPNGSPETVYTLQVVEDCDVSVALSSGSYQVFAAHGQDSTDWVAYGSGHTTPQLWIRAGEWFSWKYRASPSTLQDMRPQALAHTYGVGAGGGSGSTPDFDSSGTVDITLHDTSHSLESINDAGLAAGMNKAALRSGDLWEIIQFQTATLVAPGQYQLSNLFRGVDGSVEHMTGHAVGDDFVLLSTVINVDAPKSELNHPYLYKGVTSGKTLASAPAVEFTNTGVGAEGYFDDVVTVIPPFVGDSGDSTGAPAPAAGLVPAPAEGDCADGKFLSACGTWEVPGGASSSGGFVPTYIAPGETFTVPADRQALFAITIDNDGILDIAGALVEVD